MQKKKFILRLLQESIDYNACIILVCKEWHVFEVNLVYLSHHWILGYLHWISVSHYGLFPLLPILGICLNVLWKLGWVWLNVNYFPGVKYFQVKIFSEKENIFKCLVAFQKMLWKIFSSVWLCFENVIFLLVSHIFSTIFSVSKQIS